MRTTVINQEDSLGKTENRLSEKKYLLPSNSEPFCVVTYTRLYFYLWLYIMRNLDADFKRALLDICCGEYVPLSPYLFILFMVYLQLCQ